MSEITPNAGFSQATTGRAPVGPQCTHKNVANTTSAPIYLERTHYLITRARFSRISAVSFEYATGRPLPESSTFVSPSGPTDVS